MHAGSAEQQGRGQPGPEWPAGGVPKMKRKFFQATPGVAARGGLLGLLTTFHSFFSAWKRVQVPVHICLPEPYRERKGREETSQPGKRKRGGALRVPA